MSCACTNLASLHAEQTALAAAYAETPTAVRAAWRAVEDARLARAHKATLARGLRLLLTDAP